MGKGLERQHGPESKKEKYIIVEIGSGTQPYINRPEISDKYLKKFRRDASLYYFGLDTSGGAMGVGRSNFKRRDIGYNLEKTDRVNFVLASGSQLPFRDDTVSEVIFRNVLGDPEANNILGMMQDAERVLKVGGILKVIETYTPQVARRSISYLSRVKSFEQLSDAEKAGFVDETEIDEEMVRDHAGGFVVRFRKKELAS